MKVIALYLAFETVLPGYCLGSPGYQRTCCKRIRFPRMISRDWGAFGWKWIQGNPRMALTCVSRAISPYWFISDIESQEILHSYVSEEPRQWKVGHHRHPRVPWMILQNRQNLRKNRFEQVSVCLLDLGIVEVSDIDPRILLTLSTPPPTFLQHVRTITLVPESLCWLLSSPLGDVLKL